ncbi:oligosaccharide flippase family protein [Acinetobacter sp. SAAs470]|nr:oligosaccharide flippase family protein [Acinetobacter sp. SAAs470]WOE30883.1 oligosaccharide flippase family protein [Acinetobacter sp. SAAs470]WOE39078.1 oligosaccharide flippase family protein [Acinetobacter sp. SAAs474]
MMTFIALPFLTRLYSVADFGEYGIALAIVSVLSTVANLRLDQALLIADHADQKSLIFESCIFSVIFCMASAIILSFFFNLSIVCAVFLGILSNSLIQAVYNYQFSHQAELFCAGLNLLRSVLVIAVQLCLPILMSITLVMSYAVSAFLITLLLLFYIQFKRLYQVSWHSFKHYQDFIFANTPHALLNSFSHNLPYYVVSHFMGYQAVGYYSIVERTLRVPINLMSQTLRQFFIRKFKDNISSKIALKNSIALSIISLPFFALFLLIPESWYLMVFGQEWTGIQVYFQILALGYWAVFCNPPSSAYLIAKRQSSRLFKLQIIELLIKLILFAILYYSMENKMYMLIAVPIALIFYNFAILYRVGRDHR